MERDDRKYLESHEWARLDGNAAIVGISNHAQEELGDITFVEPPEPGAKLAKGDECGVIESVKAASDLYAPLSGTVSEVNEALEEEPEVINSDPYGKGWIFKLTDVDESEMDGLMDAKAYEEFLESEE